MATTLAPEPKAIPIGGEQRVTLRGITWQGYQDILRALPNNRSSRLTFDNGVLEITVPLQVHEFSGRLIELFIRILVVELGLKLKTMGSTTLNREDLNRGAEPDNAYYIQSYPKVIGKIIDLAQDPPPDLIVEVDITNSDIDKNRLYASMGTPEFWRFDGDIWQILALRDSGYVEVSHSPTFNWIDKEDLYRFLEQARIDEVEAEIEFRAWVRVKRSDLN
ncbi:MAG: Uma2 family endonuclease [Alkalinema sp. CAN_BIN05]|nr:Uma2 family endonuclease [Alkalinema sp. CAN_BIN05]